MKICAAYEYEKPPDNVLPREFSLKNTYYLKSPGTTFFHMQQIEVVERGFILARETNEPIFAKDGRLSLPRYVQDAYHRRKHS
jgi:hypothetical protein